jgi:hypothetical protein
VTDESKLPALPEDVAVLVAELRAKGDAAYCRMISDAQHKPECLGWEAKMKSGGFGAAELTAHKEMSELFGKYRAYHDAACALSALAASQAVAAVAEDAGRYRWLRANKYAVGPHVIQFGQTDAYTVLHGDALDAAIDAARKQEDDHAR